MDLLVQQVADANNLELGDAFQEAGPVGKKVPSLKQPEKESAVTDDLEARLANLRS